MNTDKSAAGVLLELPGRVPERLKVLALDFNGTLALDGRLLTGVAGRLRRLARGLEILVLTADTYGSARKELAGLPLSLVRLATGSEKARLARRRAGLAAVGNGRNDLGLLRAARVGVAVLGPEGCSTEILAAADLVARDINAALDLFLHPRRLTAGLRA